jgi:hypothetical protein
VNSPQHYLNPDRGLPASDPGNRGLASSGAPAGCRRTGAPPAIVADSRALPLAHLSPRPIKGTGAAAAPLFVHLFPNAEELQPPPLATGSTAYFPIPLASTIHEGCRFFCPKFRWPGPFTPPSPMHRAPTTHTPTVSSSLSISHRWQRPKTGT